MSKQTDHVADIAKSDTGRASACSGKQRFENFALANEVARRSNRNSGGTKAYHAYRCACSGWHVGNQTATCAARGLSHRFKTRRAAARFIEGDDE